MISASLIAIRWILSNWRLALLMIVVALLSAMMIRISWLDRQLESSQKKARQLKEYKDEREGLDEIDSILGDDADTSRQFLRRRKRSSA